MSLQQEYPASITTNRRPSTKKNTKTDGRHKLLSLWEGPFIVAKVTRPGTYKLITEDGKEVNNTWHISQLRKFYTRKQLKEEYIYKPQEIKVHDQQR